MFVLNVWQMMDDNVRSNWYGIPFQSILMKHEIYLNNI
jgi:hypothetical protein